ncbi:carbonic anhydrase [Pseudomonas arsenicoxydans]|uniref:Carbonic anhydrase n=1 Tax=Pseudomonas arsenicoxydans TaxID=702115 RepID=A0A502HGZ2_9PSED|nr:carbonic anhydrase [Pseudomonas arsenicoxydans]TPG73921.1 carbonic anhydrase [Pseudomonas arsenicoxydans]
MDFLQTLIERNAAFAQNDFAADLKIIPSQKTLILGCVDPRVDPVDVLKLGPGEAAVIRNVGGRVNPALFETMAILGTVSKLGGAAVGQGWNLIVLHHTDCGISGCYHHAPELLAKHMGVATDELAALEIDDPYKAVAIDVAALKANPNLPGAFTVTGLVYDVTTGLIETVVPAGLLRAE